MADPEATLRNSPVDFEFAVAYALHPEMRRLIILYVVGALLLPFGLSMLIGSSVLGFARVLGRAVGLVLAVVGATFLFGGLVGALFKLVTDANILAGTQYGDREHHRRD